MSELLFVGFVGVPLGVGAAAFLGMILQSRDSNRSSFTKRDRAQRSFHGRNQ